jgi:hypothetical protein
MRELGNILASACSAPDDSVRVTPQYLCAQNLFAWQISHMANLLPWAMQAYGPL